MELLSRNQTLAAGKEHARLVLAKWVSPAMFSLGALCRPRAYIGYARNKARVVLRSARAPPVKTLRAHPLSFLE